MKLRAYKWREWCGGELKWYGVDLDLWVSQRDNEEREGRRREGSIKGRFVLLISMQIAFPIHLPDRTQIESRIGGFNI